MKRFNFKKITNKIQSLKPKKCSGHISSFNIQSISSNPPNVTLKEKVNKMLDVYIQFAIVTKEISTYGTTPYTFNSKSNSTRMNIGNGPYFIYCMNHPEWENDKEEFKNFMEKKIKDNSSDKISFYTKLIQPYLEILKEK